MAATPDIAVVGAGIVGLATAHVLRERGVAVRVYEPGAPGAGQSGGATRIFRHGHDDARLAAAAPRSRALWRGWGERLGLETVSADGAVAIGAAVPHRLGLLSRQGGVHARALTPADLAAVMPALAGYGGPAMIDEGGGAIRAAGVVSALARSLGEAIVTDEVLAVIPREGGGVDVVAGGGRSRYAAVVVCAGRGTEALARTLGLVPPVEVSAHVRLTFRVRGVPPPRLPCLQDSSGAFGEGGAYGAPLPGNREYAVGIAAPPGALRRPEGLDALERRTRAYVARALPGLDPEPVGARACWVTRLPWGADGVAVWQAADVHLLVGNNLFKHAPLLGHALADLATGAPPALDLAPAARLGHAG